MKMPPLPCTTGSSLFLILLTLLATGCAQQEDTGLPQLRVDVVSVGTQAIPARVIKSRGLDTKHGYELVIRQNSGNWGAQWMALQSGEVDVAIGSWLEVSAKRHNGIEATMIQPFMGLSNALVVPIDSPIQRWEQLRGYRLGLYNAQAPDWHAIRAVMQAQFRFDPSEVNTIVAGAPNLLTGFLDQGEIEAAFTYGDVAVRMVATGRYRIIGTAAELLERFEIAVDAPFIGYVTKDEFLATEEELLRAFLASYAEAVALLREDQAIWNEIASDLFDIDDPHAIAMLRERAKTAIFDRRTDNPHQAVNALYQMVRPALDEELYPFAEVSEAVFSPVTP